MFFGITFRELRLLFLGTIYGIAAWFVFSGAKDFWVENFPNISSFWAGLVVILLFMIAYKYRGVLPFK